MNQRAIAFLSIFGLAGAFAIIASEVKKRRDGATIAAPVAGSGTPAIKAEDRIVEIAPATELPPADHTTQAGQTTKSTSRTRLSGTGDQSPGVQMPGNLNSAVY